MGPPFTTGKPIYSKHGVLYRQTVFLQEAELTVFIVMILDERQSGSRLLSKHFFMGGLSSSIRECTDSKLCHK